jgi:flagellar basal-body rod modification protein FlgD
MENINPASLNVFDKINSSNKTSEVKSQAEEDTQMFMRLMIAQLQNQDPTNPADTSDFMQQIAGMSQVEGINKVSLALEGMETSLMASQSSLQASAMIGKTAFTQGDQVYVTPDVDGRAMIELDNTTSNVMVEVVDSNGSVVSTQNMGTLPAGSHPLTISGKDFPEGTYTFNVKSINGEKSEALPLYVGAKVNSVTMGQNGIGLTVNTTAGSFNLKDVRQIG